MKNTFHLFLCFLLLLIVSCSSNTNENSLPETPNEEKFYFPPLNATTWETKTISELEWNENQLQPLLDYLKEKNTKSFMILHNGKIVVEEYMNGHDASKVWYWASAGKTLTSTLTGIAIDEGIISLNNKVSKYIGTKWTSASLEKENLITCKNLLSMNSGLDDRLGDEVLPSNLHYFTDAGNRWAYHNVYVKLQDVIAQANSTTWNSYFNSKLKDRIGMTGSWIKLNSSNVYWSTTRSMARFGILIGAKGKWNDSQIVSESFLNEATNSSQNINESYGYLWWLNGKNNYLLPKIQTQLSGSLIPNAPNDMYAALGKNDQKIYIVPSKNIVIIRMGEEANTTNLALSSFDNELWSKINSLIN